MKRFILLVLGALIATAGWSAVVTDEIPGLPGSLSEDGGFLSLPSINTNSEMAMLLMKALKSAPKEARVRDAERVLALDPADRTAQQTLARLYLSDNRLDEAAALLWKAARANPADLNSLEEFGFALLASGGHQGGYTIYQELYRVGHRTPAVLFNLAAAQHHLGRYAEAQALMKDFLATHPDHLRGLYNLGVMAYAAGAQEQAAATWKRVVQLQPAQPLALAALVRQQREAGQTDLAEQNLQALGKSIGEPAAKALLESNPLPIYLIR